MAAYGSVALLVVQIPWVPVAAAIGWLTLVGDAPPRNAWVSAEVVMLIAAPTELAILLGGLALAVGRPGRYRIVAVVGLSIGLGLLAVAVCLSVAR